MKTTLFCALLVLAALPVFAADQVYRVMSSAGRAVSVRVKDAPRLSATNCDGSPQVSVMRMQSRTCAGSIEFTVPANPVETRIRAGRVDLRYTRGRSVHVREERNGLVIDYDN